MILEHFSSGLNRFRPTNIGQYTVLQVVRHFHAESSLKQYLLAAERHPSRKLVKAYHIARLARDKDSAFFSSLNH